MDDSTRTALARRLAAYAATAGVVLALPTPEADAQVVYHDYDPDLSPSGGGWYSSIGLDFDLDGAADFRLIEWVGSYSYYCKAYDYGFEFDGVGANALLLGPSLRRPGSRRAAPRGREGRRTAARAGATYYYLARLSAGDIVGPNGSFDSYAIGVSYRCTYAVGNFHNEEGYAGFRFIAGDGQRHYGWMRVRGGYYGNATVYEYAYEATPETPIAAGARSAALLDGALSPTTIPADGATLDYAYTATNTTDAPLEIDLWIEVHRAGQVETALLGTLALPAGGSVTDTASWAFPADAPGGRYDVRLKLGAFASGAYVTFERFEVTKDGVGVGAEEGEGLVVGTHVLSEAVPNPSRGRMALTLTVAAPQQVTVTVHDALGRRVAVLHDGVLAAGEAHRLEFDGSELPSGVYVVRAVGAAFSDTRVVSLAR